MGQIFSLYFLMLIIVFSGMFSAAETALLSFKSMNLEDLKKKSPRTYEALKYWKKNSNTVLSTILIINSGLSVLVASLATALIAKRYPDSENLAIFISTSAVTIVMLIFGEITPKIIAKNYSDKVSKIVIIPIRIMSKIFFPLVFILTHIAKLIGRLLGLNIVDKEIKITEGDIRSYISEGKAEGAIAEDKKDMLEGVFSFSNLRVHELAVPRQNVFMLKSSQIIKDVIGEIVDKGFSRIPVYEDNIDNIVGIVYVKDLINTLQKGSLNIPLKKIMRDIFFVPETKSAFSLLKEFRESKIHMAAVIDEYGGTVGVVTIEDILEEIVGDIKDEFDKEQITVKKMSANKYLVQAALDVDEVNSATGLNIPESEEYDSLGGFLISITGKVPEKSENISWGNAEFHIRDVSKNAITFVVVTIKGSENRSENREEQ